VITQQKNDLTLRPGRAIRTADAPQLARRATEQREEGFVEAADAAESRSESDFGHRQARLMDKLLGEQDAPRLRYRNRRCAEVLAEQPAKLPLPETEAAGQGVHVIFVERAEFDQAERARHRVRGAAPCAHVGRSLGAAAQARAKAGLLRGGRSGKEHHIARKRRPRRTHRAAIDAGRLDAGEEAAVKAGVAVNECAVAGVVIEVHDANVIARSSVV
jgi:hypothetical protein